MSPLLTIAYLLPGLAVLVAMSRTGEMRRGTEGDLAAGATAIAVVALWPLMVFVYALIFLGRLVR